MIKATVNKDDSVTVQKGKTSFRVAIEYGKLMIWHEDLVRLDVRQDEDGQEAYVSVSK